MLQQHGTRLFRLKPVNIIQAAEADLRLRRQKLEQRSEPSEAQISQRAPYAFCSQHVRGAKSVSELLARALKDRDRGLGSGKRMTRVIYEDEEILRAAEGIASQSGDG